MCGIVGYFNPVKAFERLEQLDCATRLISHRGPDDEGFAVFNLSTNSRRQYVGPDSPDLLKQQYPCITRAAVFPHHLAFGFRRFSIVDLSERGHQPFWSEDRSLCLIFNGEIYNYLELQEELRKCGRTFRTNCDTEVLLAGYQEWGMEVLKKCNGPVAMVLYDSRQRRLFMARDRIGKAPLYYAVHQGTLCWASEIKAILSMTGQSAFAINEQAVYDYINFGWRDIENNTFWQGIHTLEAACWTSLEVDKPPTYERLHAALNRYWDFPRQRLSPKDIPFKEAVACFREIFTNAVKIRARADAKVAFSLSGGLDSSSIVSVAASSLPQSFRTYSIKFPGSEFDEEPLAQLVYERYSRKIDYQIHTPTKKDFWEQANDLIWQVEEPFHYPDIEQFQAYLRNARADSYKVVLVGGGGDELLMGYYDYFFPVIKYLGDHHRFLPMVTNLFLKSSIWPKYCVRKRLSILQRALSNDGGWLRQYSPFSFFNRSGKEDGSVYLKQEQFSERIVSRKNFAPQYFDERVTGYLSHWLMNYWLRNADKTYFAVPVETRRPFLDYRLVDYVLALPPEYLLNYGWTKFILRKSMQGMMPRQIVWCRKKRGMPFDSAAWFRHAKSTVQGHLNSVADNPYINVPAVMNNYDRLIHQDPALLWRTISLGLWWKRVIEKKTL